MPFYNYMGPGTHIVDRIKKGVLPVNDTDRIALAHDINYMIADGLPQLIELSDQIAMSKASGTGSNWLKTGLVLREILHLKEGYTPTRKVGVLLRDYVLKEPIYKGMFSPSDFLK